MNNHKNIKPQFWQILIIKLKEDCFCYKLSTYKATEKEHQGKVFEGLYFFNVSFGSPANLKLHKRGHSAEAILRGCRCYLKFSLLCTLKLFSCSSAAPDIFRPLYIFNRGMNWKQLLTPDALYKFTNSEIDQCHTKIFCRIAGKNTT